MLTVSGTVLRSFARNERVVAKVRVYSGGRKRDWYVVGLVGGVADYKPGAELGATPVRPPGESSDGSLWFDVDE